MVSKEEHAKSNVHVRGFSAIDLNSGLTALAEYAHLFYYGYAPYICKTCVYSTILLHNMQIAQIIYSYPMVSASPL